MSSKKSLSIEAFHERLFHWNSNSMKNSFCTHPRCREVIAVKFCIWHDSCAVVVCAKFYSDVIPYNAITPETNFPLNWNYDGEIVREKGPFPKWPARSREISQHSFTIRVFLFQVCSRHYCRGFLETSAKNGANVQEAFAQLAQSMLEIYNPNLVSDFSLYDRGLIYISMN